VAPNTPAASLLGDLFRKQAIVHMAVVMTTLLKSGIVFLRAIQIAQRTSRNLALRDALQNVNNRLRRQRHCPALEKPAGFRPWSSRFSPSAAVCRLKNARRLATVYDREVNSSASARRHPRAAADSSAAASGTILIMATVLPIWRPQCDSIANAINAGARSH